jgi:RNA polymerase-binding protein DksA
MHHLTSGQRESLQAAMGARATELREALGTRSLEDHREDTDDDAVIDQESAMEVNALERHSNELKALEAALKRLQAPDYGECADCGEGIPYVRLQANPLATRCTACQGQFERTHAQAGHAKL